MLRLPLDTTDPIERRRVESMFSAAFSIRRAVQRDARGKARAYRAARHERRADPAAARARLGLSRSAFEHAAYAHLDGAPHLRRSLTKALAMHLADTVWSATERHLFRDARGERHGMPRIGGWFDFARIPGRARSHTTERKWETFRLHGSLDGHRAAYARSDGSWFQPDRMRPIAAPPGGWWSYTGPLAVVVTGLPIGTLVLPVRLPAAPSNQPILEHHLADPTRWHKIDLVRDRDPTAPGGWRYEAHLMVLTSPYVAPAVRARREHAAVETAGRHGGIDVNVSNVTVASHAAGGDLQITRVMHDDSSRRAMATRAQRQRRRNRHLDRSRRGRNPDQYELSARQLEHLRRKVVSGLPLVRLVPKGPRKRRTNGTPLVAYRHDSLSNTYRRERAAAACDAAAATQARRALAREIAARFVRDHGCRFVVEDCDLRTWARRWGRRLAAFTPGTLVSALEREAGAVATMAGIIGGVARASTRTTALSQHCLCGARVAKLLGERTHACTVCGLRGDRDAVSATLGACVTLADRTQPRSAEVDLPLAQQLLAARDTRARLFATLPYALHGRQDVLSESTVHSARDGWFVAEKGPSPDLVVVARRIAGTASYPTLDERGDFRRHTTPDRGRTRTSLHRSFVDYSTQLRDSS
ncbi:MAG: hypothetical protein JWP01_361 [Myxococcales bacterium]|nr:hypothetical protein [Myxococcales bacterium]